MEKLRNIGNSPLVPIPFPDGRNITLQEVNQFLRGRSPFLPTVIFLFRQTVEFPNPCPIEYKIIYLPKGRLPDGIEFSLFKRFISESLDKSPTQFIGVCTRRNSDLCYYFIIRWLIEELSYSLSESLSVIQEYYSQGITKTKYLQSLKDIYLDITEDGRLMNKIVNKSNKSNNNNKNKTILSRNNNNNEIINIEITKEIIEGEEEGKTNYKEEKQDETVFYNIGRNVDYRNKENIRNSLRILLEVPEESIIFSRYYQFNSRIVNHINNDITHHYICMPEPPGKRCLLFLRGPERYLISDNDNFTREVNIYLPENNNRTQCLTSTILEGILTYSPTNTRHKYYYITDIYRYEGEDLQHKTYDSRMGYAFKVIQSRKHQERHKLFVEEFQNDDFSIELRPYLRLKYLDTLLNNPHQFLPIDPIGIVFCNKDINNEKYTKFYIWTEHSQDPITVQITNDYTHNESFGSVVSGSEMTPIFSFGRITETLEKYDGQFVDVEMTDVKQRTWRVCGLSEEYTATTLRNFQRILQRAQGTLYSKEDLQRDIQQTIQLPQYVDEERAIQS